MSLPQPHQYTADGVEIVAIPIYLLIDVDPLDGFTAEEAIQIAKDRLADLPLKIELGGVPITAEAEVPLYDEPPFQR